MDLKKLSILILMVEMFVLLSLFYLIKTCEKHLEHMQKQQIIKSLNSEDIVFERMESTPEEIENLPFLKTFRNPCFWTTIYLNKPRLRLQCIPYFYLAGFPKCGTTDLCKRMVTHPLISGKCGKENHWLTRKRFLENNNVLSNYFNYYERSVREDISNIFANGYHSAIFGDCSASTVWDNRHFFKEQKRQNKTKPLLTTADIIFKLNPNAKIIIILRNPTLRLYSDYVYFNKHNVTPEDFHNRVVKGIGAFQTCLRFQNIEECANNFNQKDSVRLNIGLYYIYIGYFLRVFPKDQVKIIKLEDFSVNKLFHMRNIFYFLEVGIPSAGILNRVVDMAKTNNNTEKKTSAGNMWTKTEAAIDSFYKLYNKKLAELIGQEFNYNT